MEAPAPRGPRLRELGLRIGTLEPGPANAITDVAGVKVGHVTIWRDEPDPPSGRGIARTGVTAIVPGTPGAVLDPPLRAGLAVLNGAGELTGAFQVAEWGRIETPIYLTAAMAVGRIYDGAVAAACAADTTVGDEWVVLPIVGECDDSWLNDARIVQVDSDAAADAVAKAAAGNVAEGCVGAGTGMVTFGWKAGIGTSSRAVAEAGATVGVLVLANLDTDPNLRIDGVPVGRELGSSNTDATREAGSCIAVVATDAPIGSSDLERLARRCSLGLGRAGSTADHGSGEIFLAFSTSSHADHVPSAALSALFQAVVDATEEAVINALWAAVDTVGRRRRVVKALPHDPVLELLERHGRLTR